MRDVHFPREKLDHFSTVSEFQVGATYLDAAEMACMLLMNNKVGSALLSHA